MGKARELRQIRAVEAREYEFSNSEAYNALVEVCPHLLHQVVTETRFDSDGYWDYPTMEGRSQPQPMYVSSINLREVTARCQHTKQSFDNAPWHKQQHACQKR